ncbi:MAG: hypothetical protein AAGJ81_04735 [Verrucomicrobiota bacterium]
MRTTLDIPDETFRKAKIAAVERGITLREIVVRALNRELIHTPEHPVRRAQFPIFQSKAKGLLTPEVVREAEREEDESQDGLTR